MATHGPFQPTVARTGWKELASQPVHHYDCCAEPGIHVLTVPNGLATVLGVGGLLLAACGGGSDPTASGPSPSHTEADGGQAGDLSSEAPAPGDPHDRRACPEGQQLFGESDDVQEAPVDAEAQFPWERSDPVVADGFDLDRVVSGGPPPDGIASIDAPCFEPVDAADGWLEDDSPVLSVQLGGAARAYPLSIMTQHEIVNDVVAGEPLAVTYCPLCNSGLAFHRAVDGQVLDFGTSGRLFQSNLVMYDRQTRSLWIQFTGRAIAGEPWVGTELERIATGLVAWSEFREAHPDGLVLSRDTGFGRTYGTNPYPNYEERASQFLFEGPTDDRLDPNGRVVGLTGPDQADPVAVPLGALAADTVDGGRDVGQTGAFRPTVDGEELTFSPAPGDDTRFVDEQTGSTWNILGEAVAGELAGTTLEEIPRDDTFWFVWFAFHPDTAVTTGDGQP